MSGTFSPIIGHFPADIIKSLNPTTTREYRLGTEIEVYDYYWGRRTLVYCLNAAAATLAGKVHNISPVYVATLAPVTGAGLGAICGVALANMDASTYGWFIVEGSAPVWSYATVAANAIVAIDSAHAGGVIASGSGHLRVTGIQLAEASTTTSATSYPSGNYAAAPAPVIQSFPSTTRIKLTMVDGLFQGLVCSSATVLTSSQYITYIDPFEKEITISAAADAVAPVGGTLVATYQGTSNIFWSKCILSRPVAAWAVS